MFGIKILPNQIYFQSYSPDRREGQNEGQIIKNNRSHSSTVFKIIHVFWKIIMRLQGTNKFLISFKHTKIEACRFYRCIVQYLIINLNIYWHENLHGVLLKIWGSDQLKFSKLKGTYFGIVSYKPNRLKTLMLQLFCAMQNWNPQSPIFINIKDIKEFLEHCWAFFFG